MTQPFLSKEEQAAKIQKITSFLSSLELVNDLKGLAQTLRSSQKSSSLEKVKLCKGWEDLFLSGSEIAGSCQRIDGYAKHNKCLIAYCLDGKNSMIAVKDPDEKILARSILRLLWDKTNSKPVLFLERLYPNPCPKERKNAILSGASICAKVLGLEIFTSWDLGLSSDGNLIESLGSSSPYEYSDGAGGVMDNGLFTIRNAQKIPLI